MPIYVQSVQCYAGHGLSMTELKHLKESLYIVCSLKNSCLQKEDWHCIFLQFKGCGFF